MLQLLFLLVVVAVVLVVVLVVRALSDLRRQVRQASIPGRRPWAAEWALLDILRLPRLRRRSRTQ